MEKDPIDIWVGSRVKRIRSQRGITQIALAKSIGVAFQQVQKYEKGENRISASRLYRISQVCEVPIEYFFLGVEGHDPKEPPPELEISAQEMDLVQRYRKLKNPLHKSVVRTVINSLSTEAESDIDVGIQGSE